MRFAFLCVLMALVVCVGCEKEEPAPVIEEPPPPDPREIAQGIIQTNGLNNPVPPPGWQMPPGAGEQFVQKLRQAYTANNSTPEGKEALMIVSRAIEERLRSMQAAQHWESVKALAEAFVVYNPGSTKYDRAVEEANVQLRKPRITKIIFFHDAEFGTTARMDIFVPLDKETYKWNARVGEEAYGLKFVEIIGDNAGVRLEYKETGETFDVLFKDL